MTQLYLIRGNSSILPSSRFWGALHYCKQGSSRVLTWGPWRLESVGIWSTSCSVPLCYSTPVSYLSCASLSSSILLRIHFIICKFLTRFTVLCFMNHMYLTFYPERLAHPQTPSSLTAHLPVVFSSL